MACEFVCWDRQQKEYMCMQCVDCRCRVMLCFEDQSPKVYVYACSVSSTVDGVWICCFLRRRTCVCMQSFVWLYVARVFVYDQSQQEHTSTCVCVCSVPLPQKNYIYMHCFDVCSVWICLLFRSAAEGGYVYAVVRICVGSVSLIVDGVRFHVLTILSQQEHTCMSQQ